MPINKRMSPQDPNQIVRYSYDDEKNASRVTVVETEMAIELDADDGDSVQTQSRLFEAELTIANPIGIDSVNTLKLYCQTLDDGANGYVRLYVSPETSGNMWYYTGTEINPSSVTGETVASDRVSDVIARRMKVESDVDPAKIKIIMLGRG